MGEGICRRLWACPFQNAEIVALRPIVQAELSVDATPEETLPQPFFAASGDFDPRNASFVPTVVSGEIFGFLFECICLNAGMFHTVFLSFAKEWRHGRVSILEEIWIRRTTKGSGGPHRLGCLRWDNVSGREENRVVIRNMFEAQRTQKGMPLFHKRDVSVDGAGGGLW